MRIVVIVLLLAAAHFSLTPFAPAEPGKAWILWPFAADSKPLLGFLGGMPQQSGSIFVPAAAGIAGLCFLAAVLSLLGIAVPADWWPGLVIAGVSASIVLYAGFFSPFALVPLALDVVLLWGVFAQHWTVAALRGG